MIKTFNENKEGRDFVVGDMHGMIELFEAFLKHSQFDPRVDRMFSVGDLIDRGTDSFACLELLDKPWFHCVKGNHEQLMEDYLSGGPTAMWWHRNGGDWWDSLGQEHRNTVISRYLPTVQKLPWLITVTNKFHIVHAELFALPGKDITDADLASIDTARHILFAHMGDGEVAIWGRDLWGSFYGVDLECQLSKARRILSNKNLFFNKKLSHIFSGHTTMIQPTTIRGQTVLDTGAFRISRDRWAGLTFAEPATNKFWTTKQDGVHEVQPLVL